MSAPRVDLDAVTSMPATFTLGGVALPIAVHMAMVRHGCHYDEYLRTVIHAALAAAWAAGEESGRLTAFEVSAQAEAPR